MGKIAGGFLLGVALSACLASSPFPFHYYALQAASYDGKLIGPTEDKDLLFKMCSPTEADKAPCMVMFTADFMRLKEAHGKCLIDLDASQRGIE